MSFASGEGPRKTTTALLSTSASPGLPRATLEQGGTLRHRYAQRAHRPTSKQIPTSVALPDLTTQTLLCCW
eukprot:15481451-Alexandrium_andersonii.AAC.1